MSGLAALPGLLVDVFVQAVAAVAIALLTVIAGIVFIFTELPGRIWAALSALGSMLLSAFTSLFTWSRAAISSFISSAASFFSQLPGRIAGVLAALPGQPAALFRSSGSSVLGAARSFGSSDQRMFSGGFPCIRARRSRRLPASEGVGRSCVPEGTKTITYASKPSWTPHSSRSIAASNRSRESLRP